MSRGGHLGSRDPSSVSSHPPNATTPSLRDTRRGLCWTQPEAEAGRVECRRAGGHLEADEGVLGEPEEDQTGKQVEPADGRQHGRGRAWGGVCAEADDREAHQGPRAPPGPALASLFSLPLPPPFFLLKRLAPNTEVAQHRPAAESPPPHRPAPRGGLIASAALQALPASAPALECDPSATPALPLRPLCVLPACDPRAVPRPLRLLCARHPGRGRQGQGHRCCPRTRHPVPGVPAIQQLLAWQPAPRDVPVRRAWDRVSSPRTSVVES